MIYPMLNALHAFTVILSALPGPFVAFITYTIIATLVIRLLLVVIGS